MTRVFGDLGLSLETEEARHGWAVDVGVENADAEPLGRESKREIGRRRRFADASLAARDRDHAPDADDRRASLARGLPALLPVARSGAPKAGRACDGLSAVSVTSTVLDALERLHGTFRGKAQAFERRRLRRIAGDGKYDPSVRDHDVGERA